MSAENGTKDPAPTTGYSKQFVTWALIVAIICSATISGLLVHKWDTVWAADLQAALAAAREKLAGLTAKQEATEKELIKERLNVKTATNIEYVPKEVVIYVDPRTGREVSSVELENLKIQQNATNFAFSVQGPSGKQYPGQFTKTETERWVFEKNKGQFTTDTNIKLTVELPKPKPQIRVGAYAGVSSDAEAAAIDGSAGIRAAYQSKPFDVDLKYNAIKKRAEADFTFWFW